MFHKSPSASRRICRDMLLWHNPLLLSHALGSCRLLVITGYIDYDFFHCSGLLLGAVDKGTCITINCRKSSCVQALLCPLNFFTVAPETKTNMPSLLRGCLGFIALTWRSFVRMFVTDSLSCHASVLSGHTSMQPCSAVPLFGAVIFCLLPVVI